MSNSGLSGVCWFSMGIFVITVVEGIVSKRKGSPLPLRPLARLGQDEERGGRQR